MPLQAEQGLYCEADEKLRDAPAITAKLLSDVIDETGRRVAPVRWAKNAERIAALMRSGAWTDAVLALIEVGLPQWQIRRIVYDAGEWRCALSRQRELPDWLDQSVESSHADLALAMLGAFVDAARISERSNRTSVPYAPHTTSPLYTPLCCDNFA